MEQRRSWLKGRIELLKALSHWFAGDAIDSALRVAINALSSSGLSRSMIGRLIGSERKALSSNGYFNGGVITALGWAAEADEFRPSSLRLAIGNSPVRDGSIQQLLLEVAAERSNNRLESALRGLEAHYRRASNLPPPVISEMTFHGGPLGYEYADLGTNRWVLSEAAQQVAKVLDEARRDGKASLAKSTIECACRSAERASDAEPMPFRLDVALKNIRLAQADGTWIRVRMHNKPIVPADRSGKAGTWRFRRLDDPFGDPTQSTMVDDDGG